MIDERIIELVDDDYRDYETRTIHVLSVRMRSQQRKAEVAAFVLGVSVGKGSHSLPRIAALSTENNFSPHPPCLCGTERFGWLEIADAPCRSPRQRRTWH